MAVESKNRGTKPPPGKDRRYSAAVARSTNTTLVRARKDAGEAKKALAEAEKSRRSTDARQWLDLALRKLAEATSAVQDVSDRLEAVETRHGPVPLTRRVQEPA